MKQADALIEQLSTLTRRMIILADKGQALAVDDGCRVLFGILHDSAYKLSQAAALEQGRHRARSAAGHRNKLSTDKI